MSRRFLCLVLCLIFSGPIIYEVKQQKRALVFRWWVVCPRLLGFLEVESSSDLGDAMRRFDVGWTIRQQPKDGKVDLSDAVPAGPANRLDDLGRNNEAKWCIIKAEKLAGTRKCLCFYALWDKLQGSQNRKRTGCYAGLNSGWLWVFFSERLS